jgi:hypothetical protein
MGVKIKILFFLFFDLSANIITVGIIGISESSIALKNELVESISNSLFQADNSK